MRNPAVSILLGIFLLGSVSLLFVAKKDNNDLYRDLTVTRSKADSLSKGRESLGNDLKMVKGKNDSLIAKSGELEKSLASTRTKLAEKEREIFKTKKTTDETNKKYSDLLNAQKEWDKQLTALKTTNEQLGQENKTLAAKTSSLNADNIQLTGQLALSKTAAKDNILIETMTKSGQLNLKGKKVRKIVASLSMPSELKSPTFRIFDPNGIQLPEQNGSFDLKSITETSGNSGSGNSVKIELTYLLSKKIGPGLYKIEMLSENKHIGNLLFRFR